MRNRNMKSRHEIRFHQMFPEAYYSIIIAHVQPDFIWPSIKLAVEIDGEHHRYGRHPELDKLKESILRFLGYTVLRFSNRQVETEPREVQAIIKSTISKLKATPPTP